MIIKSSTDNDIACIKWMDAKSVILPRSNIGDNELKSKVIRRRKGIRHISSTEVQNFDFTDVFSSICLMLHAKMLSLYGKS